VFLPGGWLRTGDVGKWVGKDVKTLAVVDRIKNLVKLRSGEYVALEKMESVFKACSVVGNICVVKSDIFSFNIDVGVNEYSYSLPTPIYGHPWQSLSLTNQIYGMP